MDPAADLSLTTGLARDPPLCASCGCGLVEINTKLPGSASLSMAVAGFFCDARAPSPAFFPMVGSCVLHEFELYFLFWRPFFAVTSSHPPDASSVPAARCIATRVHLLRESLWLQTKPSTS